MQRRQSILSSTVLLLVITGFGMPAGAQTVLLIPESSNDRVSAFSPFDGSLIDLNFITNPGTFSTPINAIDSGRGTIFVSDQVADAVFEFSRSGAFLGTVVDNASGGIDNIRGIHVSGNNLYITNAGGALADTIQAFDLNTNMISTFANVNNPFDVEFRSIDILISNIDDENIESYDFNGNFISTFHDSDGVTGIDFPEQIHETASGNVLVGGFSTPAGVYEYDSSGNQLNYYDVGSAVRGVYLLGNGNILWTDGAGVHSLDPATGQSIDIVTGASYRFIDAVTIPEPSSLVLLGTAGGILFLCRRRRSARLS